jgi:putative transposase
MRRLKSNSKITYDCQYHVIWCPKYRRKVLQYGVDVRLKEILQEVATEKKATILEIEIMPDQVHLLVSVDPQFGIHKLIKFMKGRSSRYLRLEFPWLKKRLPTLWTNSYFVATVGGATLDIIKKYIEEQKNH